MIYRDKLSWLSKFWEGKSPSNLPGIRDSLSRKTNIHSGHMMSIRIDSLKIDSWGKRILFTITS